jgi:hypothetical protein
VRDGESLVRERSGHDLSQDSRHELRSVFVVYRRPSRLKWAAKTLHGCSQWAGKGSHGRPRELDPRPSLSQRRGQAGVAGIAARGASICNAGARQRAFTGVARRLVSHGSSFQHVEHT